MTNPHRSMSHPLDPHPVRPGTSAALTARTIDATVHPPLVRAQEAVAAFIPRVSAPLLDSPLLFSMLGATLIFVWVAHRAKYRPSALLLSAALVMALTSFHPVAGTTEVGVADNSSGTEDRSWRPMEQRAADYEPAPLPDYAPVYEGPMPADPADQGNQPMDEGSSDSYGTTPDPDSFNVPPVPDRVETPSYVDTPVVPVDVGVRMITPEMMRRMMSPEAMRRVMSPEDMAVLERERAQLQIAIIQMRRQLRDEARRMARKRYY
jgi:hypothetical protein